MALHSTTAPERHKAGFASFWTAGLFYVLAVLALPALLPAAAQAAEAAGLSSVAPTALKSATDLKSEGDAVIARWSVMFQRFETPLQDEAAASPALSAWKDKVQSLKGLSARAQLQRVNDFLNARPYTDDRSVYGEAGYWGATPARFFSEGGDCKDFALAKYASLRALGFRMEQLHIAVVKDLQKNIAHAILLVRTGGTVYVLDSQDKVVKPYADVHRYHPYFLVNPRDYAPVS